MTTLSTVTAAPAAAAAAAAAAEHQAMEPRHFPFTSDILYGLGKEIVVTATKIRIFDFYNRPNPHAWYAHPIANSTH